MPGDQPRISGAPAAPAVDDPWTTFWQRYETLDAEQRCDVLLDLAHAFGKRAEEIAAQLQQAEARLQQIRQIAKGSES
jgi:hypothetical protein